MPIFLSDEEFARCSHDGALVAEKADLYIRELNNQLETVKAQADAASVTAEQTCSMLEQKYVSLFSEFTALQSENAQLNSSLEKSFSEIAQIQADKRQTYLQSIEKDGEIERLNMEASEFHKSERQLLELLEQKDIEISEKNVTIKSYHDKIVSLTDGAATREARLSDAEAELARSVASCARLSQEKELIERHNAWPNDELTAKLNSYNELCRAHNELEADMSSKLANAEKLCKEHLSALERKQDRVKDLELQLTSLQEEMCSSKDAAASVEERFQTEIGTLTKLADLYKESSEEWSKKAGELEGVIKALETHCSQVESDYKEKLDKEVSARKEFEKEVALLREKLNKCEVDLESARGANEMNLLSFRTASPKTWDDGVQTGDTLEDNHALVPAISAGVSGTALAASLLRDGWSVAKMYAKYQEAVDVLRHEEFGRKEAQTMLERVLYEIEDKAGLILDERAEHERLVEAYSAVSQKLQHSLSEQNSLQKSILELKADYVVSQKEVGDLQKQVTVLLKECHDIQLRCGSGSHEVDGNAMIVPADQPTTESDTQRIISERLVTFKDLNGLVEQNTQLRSLVQRLSDQFENTEAELKENFEKELQKCREEAASKVEVVLARSGEQLCMIESLHSSVSVLKQEKDTLINSEKRAFDEVSRLSERVHRLQISLETIQSSEEVPEEARGTEWWKREEYIKKIEKEWAEAKNDLQQERDSARNLRLQRESSLSSAMKRVEDIRKELENALRAAAAAESKAAVAEARIADLEKKIKRSEVKVSVYGHIRDSTDEADSDLQSAKEEIVKLKEEAQLSKDHMLQKMAEDDPKLMRQMMIDRYRFPLKKLFQDHGNPKLDCFLMTCVQPVTEKHKISPFSSKKTIEQEMMMFKRSIPMPARIDNPNFRMEPQLVVPTSDLEDACVFYRTVFGARILFAEEYVSGDGVEVLIGSNSFRICTLQSNATTGVFSLKIDDVHSCVEKAVTMGAVQLGKTIKVYSSCYIWCALAGVKDPYGNIWIIYSKLCPSCCKTFLQMF